MGVHYYSALQQTHENQFKDINKNMSKNIKNKNKNIKKNMNKI